MENSQKSKIIINTTTIALEPGASGNSVQDQANLAAAVEQVISGSAVKENSVPPTAAQENKAITNPEIKLLPDVPKKNGIEGSSSILSDGSSKKENKAVITPLGEKRASNASSTSSKKSSTSRKSSSSKKLGGALPTAAGLGGIAAFNPTRDPDDFADADKKPILPGESIPMPSGPGDRQSVGTAVRTAMDEHAPNVEHHHDVAPLAVVPEGNLVATQPPSVDPLSNVGSGKIESVSNDEVTKDGLMAENDANSNMIVPGPMAAMAAAGASVAAIAHKKGQSTDIEEDNTGFGTKIKEEDMVASAKDDTVESGPVSTDPATPALTAVALPALGPPPNASNDTGPDSSVSDTNAKSEIQMEGVLVKPGRLFPQIWSKRYYSIDAKGDLTYKRNQNDKEIIKTMPMNERVKVMDDNIEQFVLGAKRYIFDILYDTKTHRFGASSAEEKVKWIAAFNRFEKPA